ncbi:hypothetical protein [Sphingomonas qomolangmaensis]|uniref:Uncharacterized protein n=1 Tax=Sphingomonas qomolangmaensis TaxID=2918765 RepID=A0ABY5LE36_9SPHN|nr:hypothetical protein [Sphingomonas qomolangmaensis]UUL84049.1 hypothetical protein NMP03_07650 [Sphingomonas qomolangmaensis]
MKARQRLGCPQPRKPAGPFRYFNSSRAVIGLVVLMKMPFPVSSPNAGNLLTHPTAAGAADARLPALAPALRGDSGEAQRRIDLPLASRRPVRRPLNFDVKYIETDTTARLSTTAIGDQSLRVHLVR